jgi:hypothetical protein
MRPDDHLERETAGRLSGRLQTLIGVGRELGGLSALHDDAMRRLPADHPVALEMEYTPELRRDRDRAPSASASVPIWTDLRARAEASVGADAAVAIAVRDGQLRSRRARGRPEISTRWSTPTARSSDDGLAGRGSRWLGLFVTGRGSPGSGGRTRAGNRRVTSPRQVRFGWRCR